MLKIFRYVLCNLIKRLLTVTQKAQNIDARCSLNKSFAALFSQIKKCIELVFFKVKLSEDTEVYFITLESVKFMTSLVI